jgi:hypothetical protein
MAHFHQDFSRVERGYIVSLVGPRNIRERIEALVLEENINGKEEEEDQRNVNVKGGERKE